MDKKFIDQVLIKQDDRYVVAVTKDHNSGIVIQVGRLNPSHVRGDNGTAYKGHEPVIVWQNVVSLGVKNTQTGEIQYRDLNSIETDVKLAIGKAIQYAQKSIQTENGIDTMLENLDKEVNK